MVIIMKTFTIIPKSKLIPMILLGLKHIYLIIKDYKSNKMTTVSFNPDISEKTLDKET